MADVYLSGAAPLFVSPKKTCRSKRALMAHSLFTVQDFDGHEGRP